MRQFVRQSVSLCLALLFGVSLAASAFGWHGCPHHAAGRDEGPEQAPRSAAAAPSAPDGPLSAALADRHHDAGHHPGPGDSTCTCLGSCHAGAAPVLASHPGLAVAVDEAARTGTLEFPSRRIRHRRPAYFLPFPHGPPALG